MSLTSSSESGLLEVNFMRLISTTSACEIPLLEGEVWTPLKFPCGGRYRYQSVVVTVESSYDGISDAEHRIGKCAVAFERITLAVDIVGRRVIVIELISGLCGEEFEAFICGRILVA